MLNGGGGGNNKKMTSARNIGAKNAAKAGNSICYLQAITGTGGVAMGVVGSEGVGDFDAYVEESSVLDQFTALPIGFHNRCEKTLKWETVTCIGEHQ